MERVKVIALYLVAIVFLGACSSRYWTAGKYADGNEPVFEHSETKPKGS